MIVEAKRQDADFLLKDVTFPTGFCRFGLLAKECPDADKALRQAIGTDFGEGNRGVALAVCGMQLGASTQSRDDHPVRRDPSSSRDGRSRFSTRRGLWRDDARGEY